MTGRNTSHCKEPAPPPGRRLFDHGGLGTRRSGAVSSGSRTENGRWCVGSEPAEPSAEVRHGGFGALDVIAIFAADLALQVVLAVRVLTSHPLVVHVEPT